MKGLLGRVGGVLRSKGRKISDATKKVLHRAVHRSHSSTCIEDGCTRDSLVRGSARVSVCFRHLPGLPPGEGDREDFPACRVVSCGGQALWTGSRFLQTCPFHTQLRRESDRRYRHKQRTLLQFLKEHTPPPLQ